MRFNQFLDQTAQKNNSLLCVGLDVDLAKIPREIVAQEDPLFIFNKTIIDATKDLVCAYKPNLAFYEMHGIYGLQSLQNTLDYLNNLKIPIILDAKRGDIGHSSAAYAKSIFQLFKADATTVSPYMGHDSLLPFLEYKDKGVFVLCLTSNSGSQDFQTNNKLYEQVAKKVVAWNDNKNCGLVVGATNPEKELKEIRKLAPDLPILIPGVGAQGGNLELAVKYGVDKGGNRAIINSSRGIIYAQDPRAAAKELRDKINSYRWAK